MKQLLVTLALLGVMLIARAAIAVDATSTWNTYCSQYNFGSYPQSPTTTFVQAYSGSDFATDFAAIKAAVDVALMTTSNTIIGDDTLNDDLRDWH